MKFFDHIFKRHATIAFSVLIIFIFAVLLKAFAVSGGPFNVAETLDPDCVPGGTCQVNIFPDQTGNNGKVLQTNGASVSWETVSGGGGGTLETTVNLTPSQIKTMGTTPIEVIPAPGAGSALALISAQVKFVNGSENYAFPNPRLRIQNQGSPLNSFTGPFLDSAFTTFVPMQIPAGGGAGTDAFPDNAPIEVTANSPLDSTNTASGEVIGTGDGATAAYSGTLANDDIQPSSVSITDGTETFTDNGSGTLTGSNGGTGTITYSTGAYSLTFNANVANAQNITADYSYYVGNGTMTLYLTYKVITI